jgi:hypothetical protein
MGSLVCYLGRVLGNRLEVLGSGEFTSSSTLLSEERMC